MPTTVMLDTGFTGKTPLYAGKVRETYDIGDNRLLLITTDRLSAFDYIFPVGIPDKGKVLNQISVFWFNFFSPIMRMDTLASQRRLPFSISASEIPSQRSNWRKRIKYWAASSAERKSGSVTISTNGTPQRLKSTRV